MAKTWEAPSDIALDAAYWAFVAHGDTKSFLNHPTRKFICRECGAELAGWAELRRHQVLNALFAADNAIPTDSVG